MSDKIYIKRSVKEKLPEKEGAYYIFYDSRTKYVERFSSVTGRFDQYHSCITHWLEEMSLEEYLKEIKYKPIK